MEVTADSNSRIHRTLSIVMAGILVTAIAAIAGWHKLDWTSKDLMLGAAQYQAKNEIINGMWNTARARHAVLLAILLEDDPFKQDDLFVQHVTLGGNFIALREQLMAMELNTSEMVYLEGLGKALTTSGRAQLHVRDLVMDSALEEARSVIREPGYIEDRLTIFRQFDKLFSYYREAHRSALHEVNNTVLTDARHIIEITSIVLILAAAIGFFMTRIINTSEADLRKEVARRTRIQRELEANRWTLELRVEEGIEKYKSIEEERSRSQGMATAFGNILEESQNEIYIFDAETLKFIQVNRGARENLGYSMEELRKITPLEIKPELSLEEFNDLITPLLNGTQEIVQFTTSHKRKDGTLYPTNVHLQLSRMGDKRVFVAIILDVSEQLRVNEQLQRKNNEVEHARIELAYQQQAVDEHAIVCIADRGEHITAVNDKFVELSGFAEEELIGGHFCIGVTGENAEKFFVEMSTVIQSGNVWSGEICNRSKDGEIYWTTSTVTPFLDEIGEIYKFVVVCTDITAQKKVKEELHARNRELEQAHKEIELSHSQTLQSEKLASVGQLAAGIAHEINTPIQFVGDNTRFLQDAFADLLGLVKVYETMAADASEGEVPAGLVEKARTLSEEVEVDYLTEEVPKAISQSLEGVDRVSKIVRSMKDFSHPGSDNKEVIDINKAIESTLTVSRNEWKYNAELVTDFDAVLTAVPCYPGEFNQVILNMVVNASHAIADCRDEDSDEPGTITIATRLDDGYAEVRISDTGTGMPEAVRKRIFEPFYTTKGVGKGSGQGLAIAYTVIVDKHGGTIEVDSEPGKGTTFIIRLPMRDSIAEADTDDNPERNPGDEEAYSVC